MPRSSSTAIRERGIDIAGAAAADLGIAGLRQQAIEPQIVVEPHAHHACAHSSGAGRPAAWADSPRHPCSAERDWSPRPVAADGLGEAAQIGRRRHDLDAVLRQSRRAARASQTRRAAERNAMARKRGRAAQDRPGPSMTLVSAWRPRCSSASGNGRSSRCRRSRRPGNPSPRWQAHRHRAGRSSFPSRAT